MTILGARCGTLIDHEIPKVPSYKGKSLMFMGAAFGKFNALEWYPFQAKWRSEMRPCVTPEQQCDDVMLPV